MVTENYPAGAARDGGRPRRLGLLLLPEFSHLTLATLVEPLFVANWLSQRACFEWRLLSVDGRAVRASNGMTVPVDGDLVTGRGSDALCVLASFEPDVHLRNRALLRWLRQQARGGVELLGVENGSLPLAAAGLLEQHSAAVHWDNRAGFQELFPRVALAPGHYSFSKKRATCAGGIAVLEMMVAWIGAQLDESLADEIAQHLLLGERASRGHARGNYSPVRSPDEVIARARAIMAEAVDDPLSCAEIARRVNLSLRQLERRFRQRRGHSLQAEYRLLRVEKAHQYLQQTQLTVTEVAALTGFSSAGYFSKVYRRTFGVLPSNDRSQSTQAPVFRRRRAGGRPIRSL